ncbi:MAG: uncharacterized protein QOC81_1069 [Thermoanaerobaculia bacterium]|jgi:phage protein D|nr:uncharacterized protein [Thermoanaerobaculia bacterium]
MTTAATPIYADKRTFYAPEFRVTVGKDVPQRPIFDIIDVTFHDKINTIDWFEITLSNWDSQDQTFKYEPPLLRFKGLIEPDYRIDVHMGYAAKGELRLMSRGVITAIEPNYPESGAPTLTVRGQHLLHRAERRQYTKTWERMRDSEVAKELGNKPPDVKQPSLGIPIEIDESAKSREPNEKIVLDNLSLVNFLQKRANRRGYVFYVDPADEKNELLYFGPSDRPNRTQYGLNWGATLISFRPTFAVTQQAGRVTVCGKDRLTGEKIAETAEFPTDNDLNPELLPPKDSHDIITDPPARSIAEAKARAHEALSQFRRNVINASGSTVGLPDLRAGSYVVIGGLGNGSRFNGRYFITGTTHTIGSGGYTTSFEARREDKES